MKKEVGGAENKKKRNTQGKTFYEAVPATVAMPKAVHLPKIGSSTETFLESIVIFFAGTVEVLLVSRLIILEFGANGGNLLTFLIYALSYPFMGILASSQGQIPVKGDGFMFEMVAVMFMYFVVSYMAIRAIQFFGEEKETVGN